MEFVKQALLRSGILTPGGYITDALVTNNACICDASGRVTHKIGYAANGVDLAISEYGSGRVVYRVKLPLLS